jgi:predicted dehydrogenase
MCGRPFPSAMNDGVPWSILYGKVRVGLIGAGWWATSNHLPVLAARSDVELAAVCRLGQSELQLVKERYAFAFATEDYLALLEQPLDAVIVASPHTLHYQHAAAALARGLHVMVEKPITTSAADARALVDLAREKGVHLLVPYGWHYTPFIQEAHRLMESGVVGHIQHVSCHMASPVRDLLSGHDRVDQQTSGASSQDEIVFGPTASTWADPAIAGGGYGYAQLSHALGLLFWLTDLRAEEVYAQMSAPGARVDLYDAMSVRFAGGAIGAVSGAAGVPDGGPFQLDIRIFGDRGHLLLDVERERVEVRRHGGETIHVPVTPGEGAYTCDGPPNRFIDLILGKSDRNDSPGEAAARAVELLDAAYRSSRSHAPERV